MEYLVLFVLGFVICLVFTKKPIQIHITHTQETITNSKTEAELQKLQEDMLKPDPKDDNALDKLNEVLVEVNDVMGGSDR